MYYKSEYTLVCTVVSANYEVLAKSKYQWLGAYRRKILK